MPREKAGTTALAALAAGAQLKAVRPESPAKPAVSVVKLVTASYGNYGNQSITAGTGASAVGDDYAILTASELMGMCGARGLAIGGVEAMTTTLREYDAAEAGKLKAFAKNLGDWSLAQLKVQAAIGR